MSTAEQLPLCGNQPENLPVHRGPCLSELGKSHSLGGIYIKMCAKLSLSYSVGKYFEDIFAHITGMFSSA